MKLTVTDRVKELARKQDEAKELLKKLQRSVAINTLWPGIWELGGVVTCQWRQLGNDISLTVKLCRARQAAVEHTFPVAEVPEVLHDTMPTDLALCHYEAARKLRAIKRFMGGE